VIAAITIVRKLTEAIWWMLTRNQPFAPFHARFSAQSARNTETCPNNGQASWRSHRNDRLVRTP